MNKLLKYIARKAKRRTAFEKSEEFLFFIENRHYLTKIARFTPFYEAIDPFEIMRANVILYAYVNKLRIEKEVESLKSYINTNNKHNHNNFIKSFHEIISAPRGNPACRGTFGGRRKAVRDRFALQGGTGDFP